MKRIKDQDLLKEYFLNKHFTSTERQTMLIADFLYGDTAIESKGLTIKEDEEEVDDNTN